MRAYVLGVALLLAAIEAAVSLAQDPADPTMQIDAQSPGTWRDYCAARLGPRT